MVADHDGGSPGLFGFQRACHGHDALDDEGLSDHSGDLGQLLHGLAARRGIHVFQEGQTRRVNVHSHGEAAGFPAIAQLFLNGLQVPGLHRGDGGAAGGGDGLASDLHDLAVQTVAGEGGNAIVGTGFYENVVVSHVVIFVAVVDGDGAHGACKEGIAEGFAEQIQRGVRRHTGVNGVHVDADALPLFVVADGGVAHALGTGAGNVVAAGFAIADGAGLAVFAENRTCVFKNFLISHDGFLPVLDFEISERGRDQYAHRCGTGTAPAARYSFRCRPCGTPRRGSACTAGAGTAAL